MGLPPAVFLGCGIRAAGACIEKRAHLGHERRERTETAENARAQKRALDGPVERLVERREGKSV